MRADLYAQGSIVGEFGTAACMVPTIIIRLNAGPVNKLIPCSSYSCLLETFGSHKKNVVPVARDGMRSFARVELSAAAPYGDGPEQINECGRKTGGTRRTSLHVIGRRRGGRALMAAPSGATCHCDLRHRLSSPRCSTAQHEHRLD